VILAGIGGSEAKVQSLHEIELLQQATLPADRSIARTDNVSVLGSKALKEYIEQMAVALLVRLVPQTLPVISVITSAHGNQDMFEHAGRTAFMVYRKRFIERKKTL
jgi:hypothetical protein